MDNTGKVWYNFFWKGFNILLLLDVPNGQAMKKKLCVFKVTEATNKSHWGYY